MKKNSGLYHCIFSECTDTEARKGESTTTFWGRCLTSVGFMRNLVKACTDGKHLLMYIPEEWNPFMPPLPSSMSSLMGLVSSSSQGTPSTITTTTSSMTTTVPTVTPQVSATSESKTIADPSVAPPQLSLVEMQMPICGVW
jgi:hypothetical protein